VDCFQFWAAGLPFYVEPGAFDIMIGASSADIRLKTQVEVTR
jgi:hypothetical protein